MRFLFVTVGLIALAFMAIPLWWGFMHWALFGLVIWVSISLLRPRRSPLPPPRERARVREPRASQPRQQPMLPLDVQIKVEQIRRKAEVLMQHAGRFPFASRDLYVVRATVSDYLPRTIDAYLAVPPASREQPMANGTTPMRELKEQLALLDSKLDEIAEDLQRHNQDRLLANRRFLEERFGRVVAT
jgi:hypothetical protein